MKKVPVVLTFATLYAFFFQLTPHIGFADQAIFGLFLFSPFVVLYMAYIILKHGKPSDHTFEERFYDDYDYIRNGREKMDVEKPS